MTDDYMPRMTQSDYEAALEQARAEVREDLLPDLQWREALLAGNVRDTIDKEVLDGFFMSELEVRLRELNIPLEEKERIRTLRWGGAF